jgi:hypothetical protein
VALLVALALGLLAWTASPEAAAARTLYVAPGGSDGDDCQTPRTACASFDRGYHAAEPGDVVELAGGRYRGPQHFSEDRSKTSSADVVVRPAPGARVVVRCRDESNCLATEGADHVTLRGVRTTMLAPVKGMPRQAGVALDRGSDDVTFQDVDAGHIFIAARNASVIGGDYGPTVDQVSKIADDVGENVLIDGARFHHHLMDEDHMECIALYGARGVVIRRSRFDTCAVFAIFGAPDVGEHYRDVLIENNFFSNSGGVSMSTHLKVSSHGGDCSNFLIRNNTFIDENVISDCGMAGGTATNIRWIANIFDHWNTGGSCNTGGHVFDYNVIERGHACGPHDVVVGPGNAGFVDRRGLDLHLTPSSPAIGRGSPEHPAADIDGGPRPFGGAPDAGADEFGSAGSGSSPQADGRAPRLTVRGPRRTTLRRLLRRGLAWRTTCSERCRLRVELSARGQVVGRRARRLAVTRRARVVVKLAPKGARRVRRIRPRILELRITAFDAAGNSRTRVRTIRLST